MTDPSPDPADDTARLERLAALAVEAVAAAATGGAAELPPDPVARRVAHVVGAIAGARPASP